MSNIYFTADDHLDLKRALDLSKRPFQDVHSMNKTIIHNWNETVNKEDTVYIIGDFGNKAYLSKLNGDKILILGNYEEKEMKDMNLNYYSYKEYLFDEFDLKDVLPPIDIKVKGHSFWLCHKPSDKLDHVFTLFGHIHGRQMVKEWGGLDVGVDAHHFKPVSLEEVLFYKNAIENHYDKEVFI